MDIEYSFWILYSILLYSCRIVCLYQALFRTTPVHCNSVMTTFPVALFSTSLSPGYLRINISNEFMTFNFENFHSSIRTKICLSPIAVEDVTISLYISVWGCLWHIGSIGGVCRISFNHGYKKRTLMNHKEYLSHLNNLSN